MIRYWQIYVKTHAPLTQLKMSAGFFWLLKHRDLNVSPFLSTPNSSAFSEPKKSGDIQVAECKWGLYGNFFLGLLIQIKVKLGEFGNFKSINSVTQSCPTLCDPMNRSTPGLPVHHQLPESTQTHVHWVGDATQPCHPLSSPSPPAHSLSQHQGLLQWLSSLHQVAKVLEFQLQHQSLQWTPMTDLL